MQRSLVALVLVAIVLVVYAPIVLGGRTWDDARYHTEIAPPRIAAADAVLHGELPTWWEGSALGVPLLAEPSHGAAYPPAWIAATPLALDLLLIVHVLWCALGVAYLARRLRVSQLAGVIAGVLVATSGVIASAALRGALPALAHLPWLALISIQLARARTRRRQTRAAILIAVLLGLVGLAGQLVVLGDAIAIVLLAFTQPFKARVPAASQPPAPRVGRAPAFLAIAIVAGLAVAALQWLPALFTMAETVGPALPRLSFAASLDLVVPRASSGWFPTLYIGAPAILLAAIGRPPVGVVIVAALLAIGGFVVRGGDVQLAVFALLAATYAARGFDRVTEWVPGKLRLAVVAVALAPTVVALPMLVPTTSRSIVNEPSAWAHAAEQTTVWPHRVFRPIMSFAGKQDPSDATLADRIATLAGASSAKWGVGAARSEDAARLHDHDRVWTAASSAGGALFDRYGIALAILPVSMVGDTFRELSRRGTWALVEFPASPTAALVYEWMFESTSDAALARLFPAGAGSGLSSGMIVLQGEGAQNQDEPGPAQPCKLLRWDAGAIDLECTAARDGYAVISSTADRGWTARLDGRSVPWVVADVMRRALPVTPGAHRIEWRYAAPGLRIAVVLAALGIALLIALWLMHGRDPDDRDRAPDPERTDVN